MLFFVILLVMVIQIGWVYLGWTELDQVRQAVIRRSSEDIRFYRLTRTDVIPAFMEFCQENGLVCTQAELTNCLWLTDLKIGILKYLWNRPRPWRLDQNLLFDNELTPAEKSPSYPSGHSMQAKKIATYLSVRYPDFKEQLEQLAIRCGQNRVIMGLHFPSDLS